MNAFEISEKSWHWRFIKATSSIRHMWKLRESNLCAYIRSFIGSVILCVIVAVCIMFVVGLVSMLGASWVCPFNGTGVDAVQVCSSSFDLFGMNIWLQILIGFLSGAVIVTVGIAIFIMGLIICYYSWQGLCWFGNKIGVYAQHTPLCKENSLALAAYDIYKNKICRKIKVKYN